MNEMVLGQNLRRTRQEDTIHQRILHPDGCLAGFFLHLVTTTTRKMCKPNARFFGRKKQRKSDKV